MKLKTLERFEAAHLRGKKKITRKKKVAGSTDNTAVDASSTANKGSANINADVSRQRDRNGCTAAGGAVGGQHDSGSFIDQSLLDESGEPGVGRESGITRKRGRSDGSGTDECDDDFLL